MVKIDVTKTELVWPGKYSEDGTRKEIPRINLPFQVIESINESRATREANKGGKQIALFDVYEGKEGNTFEEGWTNKLIWGDNLLVMNSLLTKFAGKIDLIYIDPPFATGADFSFTTEIGDDAIPIKKEQSIIEEKAYRDTWGSGINTYLSMISERLQLMHNLLSENGSIYVHCDYRVNSFMRIILDDIFGSDNYRNEIIWFYPGRERLSSNKFQSKHDNIFFYSKSTQTKLNPIKKEWDRESRIKALRRKIHKDENGREWFWETRGQAMGIPQYKQDLEEYLQKGGALNDVWDDIQFLRGNHPERVGYDTQKPEKLLERIIEGSSKPGDLVADFFCGSGTTLSVSEKLGRRWIGCDLGRYAIHTSRKRLLSIENSKSFEVLNLGKYERQYWQNVTFNKEKTIQEKTLFEYLAFILKLYGAQPVPGLIHIHGKKGRATVHIGAVDAPVTIDEINASLAECVQIKQSELHILGWEWEMGLYDLMVAEAKKQGVKLVLLQIPREVMEQQAVDKGDVRFFELAYLEIEVKNPKKSTAEITLKDFVIPNTELIPEDVRSKIKKWSDYIDYWAIDWNFQNDTFMQSWVTYRTRKDRTLLLTSDPHTYKEAGTYRILVKVVDIFGNDTSQAFDVKVT